MSNTPNVSFPASYAGGSASTSPGSGASNPADFATELDKIAQTNAPLLKKREQAQKEQELAVKRIREVGLAQYTREQQEVKKLMKILHMIKKEVSGKLKETISGVIDHFETNPPETVQDVYEYMESIAAALPKGQIRDQLEELIRRIQEIMKEKALGASKDDIDRALMGLR